jgi:hypothetical protein
MARRPVMNQSKKLELSKETLRCLDDQDLMGVAGGNRRNDGGNSNNCNNYSDRCSGYCISFDCESFGLCL